MNDITNFTTIKRILTRDIERFRNRMFKTERTGAVVLDVPKKYQHLYWTVAAGGSTRLTQYEEGVFREAENFLLQIVSVHNCVQSTIEKSLLRESLRVASTEHAALVTSYH